MRTSGGFLLGLLLEDVGTEQAQVHQAGGGDSIRSPLRNGASCYLANLSDFRCAAERVNDF